MSILIEDHLSDVVIPANLRINDQVNRYREICRVKGCARPYHHFAFGQSPFSPPPAIIDALKDHASEHSYLPTAGLPKLRESIADYYRQQFAISCEAGQIVVSPGSKEMISMLLAVLQGSIIIPTPSWVSYLPQAKILKKEVISLRTTKESGYKLTPELLRHGLDHTHTKQRVLILNHPNNPTGVVYIADELADIARVCRKYDVVVISDEIYANTAFDRECFTSMMNVYPEKTIVTGGLSKDRSCGGYRLGVGIFPKEARELLDDILKIAGSTYSCVAAPIQYAALVAYSQSNDVEQYVRDCAAVNALVGRKMAGRFSKIPGVKTTMPQGGFYLFVDFNELRDNFLSLGFETCADFCEDLIKVEHCALLPGDSLLLQKDDFAVRASFVDYDGGSILAAWRKGQPSTPEEEESFIQNNCPLMVTGIDNIGRYLSQISQGERPKHA